MDNQGQQTPVVGRILVCGGRDYNDREFLFDQLDALDAAQGFKTVIHGAASGADTLAEEWANSRGKGLMAFPADWKRHGKAAGPMRNKSMLDFGRPELVLAFPGGKGTANMIAQAIKAQVPVHFTSEERRIEITPEMIKAGVRIYIERLPEDASRLGTEDETVCLIYLAMVKALGKKPAIPRNTRE